MRSMPSSIRRLAFVDGIRGLAALYVLIHHASYLIWEGYGMALTHPEQYSWLGKLFAYGLSYFGYGHQAVILFFVLSGFVIHLHYAEDLKRSPETARFGWWSYFQRRLNRIYPPLLLALALTLALDWIGVRQGYLIYFHQTPFPTINNNVTINYSPGDALNNLLLIVTTPTWGTDAPLWSLRYEWSFYLLFPALWWLSRKSILRATLVVIALFIVTLLLGTLIGAPHVPLWVGLLMPLTALSALPCWWCGVLLADIYTRRLAIQLKTVTLLTLLFLVLPLTLLPSSPISQVIADCGWGLGFTGLIAACLAWQNRGGTLRWLESLTPFGTFSYTLYVTHFPILVLLSGWLMSLNSAHQLPSDFSALILGISLCLVTAFGAHFIVEKPRHLIIQPAKKKVKEPIDSWKMP